MLASKLIVELQRLMAEHGDLPVAAFDGCDPSDMEAISRTNVAEESIWIYNPDGSRVYTGRVIQLRP